MNPENPTDEQEVLAGQILSEATLLLQTDEGEFIAFPDGLRKFCEELNCKALMIDAGGHIHVLRSGLSGKKMRWVLLTEEQE